MRHEYRKSDTRCYILPQIILVKCSWLKKNSERNSDDLSTMQFENFDWKDLGYKKPKLIVHQ